MLEGLVLTTVILLVIALVLLVLLLLRRTVLDLAPLETRLESLERGQERMEREVRDEVGKSREEAAHQARAAREELAASQRAFSDSVLRSLSESNALQRQQWDLFAGQLAGLRQAHEQRLEALRNTVEAKLTHLQIDNAAKLEDMRRTVEEKLQGTLERRLGDSFRLVSERLELVHKGLGEMQSLASGVGDLKKVLTNVKVRGTWGEMQLGNLLEQILAPEQYAQNVATKMGSLERVEFAVRLPGRDDSDNQGVWLPIDAKFPKEDYERLVEAAERADVAAVEEASRQLEVRIRTEARHIHDKYLDPPHTTDFGILFLPTEGLYAETLRRPGLLDGLQRECRVVLAGPTTLAALLNSLQIGFRTLAIQKRSSEVWAVLGAIKTEFSRFGGLLEKVQKKLQEASNVMEQAHSRSRAIERRLREVQALPLGETPELNLESEPPAASLHAEEARSETAPQ
jgi:DNA recombination protein RmuC